MARGLPSLWGTVFGGPFVAAGAYVYWFQGEYPLVENQPHVTPDAGLYLAAFGGFVIALGAYVQFVAAPEPPTMRDGEEIVDQRDPAQRRTLARTFASVPFLAYGIDLLYFTEEPYVYPTLALAVGLYLFSTGIYQYFQNTLTTYVLTNQRMLEEYRFVSLSRNEVPLSKVRSVEERRSALESLFGLGGVTVRSGEGSGLSVAVRDVYDSTEFADEIRDRLTVFTPADRGQSGDAAEASTTTDPDLATESGGAAAGPDDDATGPEDAGTAGDATTAEEG